MQKSLYMCTRSAQKVARFVDVCSSWRLPLCSVLACLFALHGFCSYLKRALLLRRGAHFELRAPKDAKKEFHFSTNQLLRLAPAPRPLLGRNPFSQRSNEVSDGSEREPVCSSARRATSNRCKLASLLGAQFQGRSFGSRVLVKSSFRVCFV